MKKDGIGLIKMLTPYDIFLIILVLIIAISTYGFIALHARKSSDDIAVIWQDGEEVLRLTQKQLGQDGIYDFRFNGGTGQIEVKDKKVRMLPMDKVICPQAICSETGWIDGAPKTIICLPNRLMVSFITDKSDGIDGVTY